MIAFLIRKRFESIRISGLRDVIEIFKKSENLPSNLKKKLEVEKNNRKLKKF